jgi:hypothetical protein
MVRKHLVEAAEDRWVKLRTVLEPYASRIFRIIEEELSKGRRLVRAVFQGSLVVKELPVDLKAVKTTREVSPGIFCITHGRESKCRVIGSNVLTEATGSRIVPL